MSDVECSYELCKHEVFQDNKCIFHCDKSDNKKWGTPTKYVEVFWKRLYLKIRKVEKNSKIQALLLPHYKFPSSPWNKRQININTELSFDSCIFLYDMTFLRLNFFKTIRFFKNKFLNNLSFNSCEIHQKLIFYWQINDKEKKEDFSFKNLSFSSCKFIENSNIELFNADINKLVFLGNINNTQKFLLTNTTIHKEFDLQSMSLKEFDFNNVDLTKAICNFQHLSFEGVVFSKIKWGNDLQNRFYIDDKREKKADREVARQIKYTYETQGDKINANKFHILEKTLYKDELAKDKDASWQDKLIFNTEGMVSEHGQSFSLPLFWIFLFSSIFTVFKSLEFTNAFLPIITIVLVLYYNIKFDESYYKERFKYLSWSIILPVLLFNSDSFFEMLDITKGSEPIDFIFKILFLFISYQFIMSVRKDTRR